ncbi:MAG TPA: hypothetical protein PKY46_14235 [Ignavibacteriaceae bacterium]|nr:hypothetical protein [Ignavibacteriaceae bacterium]
MRIHIDREDASKRAAESHPGIPPEVVEGITDILANKSVAHKAVSNYIQSVNKLKKELIDLLEKTPYNNSIGSITVHNRYNFVLTEKDVEDLKAFCTLKKLDIADLVEVKVKYNPTPAFRNILLTHSNNLFEPFYDRIRCDTNKVLHVKLSI